MKKLILFILWVIPIYAIGQEDDCPEADAIGVKVGEVEAKIKTLEAELLWNQQTFPEKLIDRKKLRNYNDATNTFSMEIENVSQKEFVELCNSGRPDMEKLCEKYPDANIYSMYSCKQEGDKTVINAYVEIIGNPKSEALEKIRNTRKLYMDILDALDNEITFNQIEIADNASELLMKTIPIDSKITGMIKDFAMEELRTNANLSPSNIDNPVADGVNKIVDITEKALNFIPGGSKVTNHYLWKLFKSTPEIGKGLGHTATIVNIYFRKREYKKLIEDLNKEEQRLMGN